MHVLATRLIGNGDAVGAARYEAFASCVCCQQPMLKPSTPPLFHTVFKLKSMQTDAPRPVLTNQFKYTRLGCKQSNKSDEEQ